MNCKGCAYDTYITGNGCAAFTEKPENCANYTTKEQAEEREREIAKYHDTYFCNQNNRGKK